MRAVGVWMNAGKNNNKQRDKKDQIDIVTNNQDKKYNSKKHLKGLQFFYLRGALRVKCLWMSWVTNKT